MTDGGITRRVHLNNANCADREYEDVPYQASCSNYVLDHRTLSARLYKPVISAFRDPLQLSENTRPLGGRAK